MMVQRGLHAVVASKAVKGHFFPLRNSTLEWKCLMDVISSGTNNAAAVTDLAEEKKLASYGNLVPSYYFQPVLLLYLYLLSYFIFCAVYVAMHIYIDNNNLN